MSGLRGLCAIPAVTLAMLLMVVGSSAAQTQAELFDDSTLQDLQLTVSTRDWNALREHADLDTYYPADLRWHGVTVRNLGIRSRGSGSRNGIKPGLRLDFNRYLTDQEFLGLKALVLDNGYTDPSTMREALAMKLYARVGLVAPREAHARVFVNGEYAGLYVIVEPIDRTFVKRVFGDDEANPEAGGYLYEYKWVRQYGFEYLGSDLETYRQMFEAQTHETDAASRLYDPIIEMVRLANETPADRLESELGARLDLSQFVRYLAVQRVVAEIDGFLGNWGMNNFYLYRFRDGRPAQILPWDADHAFWEVDMTLDEHVDTNVLASRVMENPSLRRLYLETVRDATETMTQADAGDQPGWLEREADRVEVKVEAAAVADSLSPFPFIAFESNTAGLKELLRLRAPYLMCQVAAALAGEEPSCPAPDIGDVPDVTSAAAKSMGSSAKFRQNR